MVYIPVAMIIFLILLIPVGGFIACLRDKAYRQAVVMGIISIVSVAVCIGIFYQAKASVAFAEKCEQSNGVVYQNQCFNKDAVISIKR